MLKGFRKEFNKIFNPAANVENEEAIMSVADNVPVEAAVDVTAELSKATEALATSASAMEKLAADYESMKTELEVFKNEKKLAEAVIKQNKMSARMSQIKAAIGDEKAPSLLAATENLDDSHFEAVVAAMSLSVQAETKTALFSEVGVDVESHASSAVEKSAIMTALEKQYKGA